MNEYNANREGGQPYIGGADAGSDSPIFSQLSTLQSNLELVQKSLSQLEDRLVHTVMRTTEPTPSCDETAQRGKRPEASCRVLECLVQRCELANEINLNILDIIQRLEI